VRGTKSASPDAEPVGLGVETDDNLHYVVDPLRHVSGKPLHLEDHRHKLILWPIFYSNHFILGVIQRNGRFDLHDSNRSYAHRPRGDAVGMVIQKLQKAGFKQKPTYRECEQQKKLSNDCGIHTINNALVALGITGAMHTRATLTEFVRNWS